MKTHMIELLSVLTPIALINSLWILPGGIVGVAASLGARRPILTAIAFIAGQFVPHFSFGLLLAIGLDTAVDQVNAWLRDTWQEPGVLLVVLQLAIGVAMVAFGYPFSRASKPRSDRAPSMPMTPIGAFSVAAGLTVIKLPGALPYFAAIDQVLRADPTVLEAVKALLYYNLIYLLPLMSIVLASRLFETRSDRIFAAVIGFVGRWGKRLMSFGLLGLGVVLVVDAVGWFFGFPLLPTYFLVPVTSAGA